MITVFLCVAVAAQAPLAGNETADAIMARMAANVEEASDARRRYVYRELVRSSLVRSSGEVARRERREYSAIPTADRTEKELVSFQGEYRKGKKMVGYAKPGYKYKGTDIDGEVLTELTDGLVNDKNSRDGIPHSLFPLSTKDLPAYTFALKGRTVLRGRPAWEITFTPRRRSGCFEIGADSECGSPPWAGTVWVDVEDCQPAGVQTHLAYKVPWGIRVFLGTNLHQTGFSVSYTRVQEKVWFPSTYGTEFRMNVLWGYKRTVTLSMENTGFRRTGAESRIEYATPQP